MKKNILVLLSMGLLLFLQGCNFANPMNYFKSADSSRLEETSEEATKEETSKSSNSSVINTNETSATSEGETTESAEAEVNTESSLLVYSIGNAVNTESNSLTLEDKNYSVNYANYDISNANALETADLIKIETAINENLASNNYVIVVTSTQTCEELSYFLNLTLSSENKIAVISTEILDNKYALVDSDITNYLGQLTTSELSGNILTAKIGDSLENVSTNPVSNENKIDITDLKDLSYVSIVYDYLGNDGSILEKAISNSDGIILVTTNKSGEVSETANEIINSNYSGVPVIIVSANENTDLSNYHTPTQSRILLSLALAKGANMDEIKDYFTTY